MQPRTFHLIIFFSVLLLTLACGSTAVWLAVQNPTLTVALFFTMLGLFATGAGAIIGLIHLLRLHSKAEDSPPLPHAPAPPIDGDTEREGGTRRTSHSERRKATRALPKPPNGGVPRVVTPLGDRERAGGRVGEESAVGLEVHRQDRDTIESATDGTCALDGI